MKKRTLAALVLLLCLCAVLYGPAARAEGPFTVSPLEDGGCVITGYTGEGGALVIPAQIDGMAVRGIADWAFFDRDEFTSLVLPDSLESIGQHAFCGCSALESVDFGNGLESISYQGFASCEALRAIRLPASLRTTGDAAFAGCTAVEEIVLAEGIETVSGSCFSGCTSVRELSFPDSVQTIGEGAFSYCETLEWVSFGAGLKTVENGAFSWCPNFRTVDEFPEGLERIGTDAFGGPLQNIILPDTVTEIRPWAFNVSEVKTFRWSGGAAVIPDGFFTGSPVETVEIPEGVVAIGTESPGDTYPVFFGCRNLRELSLPSTLRFIVPSAFAHCVSLEAVTLPEGLETIPGYCFGFCEALREIVIPDSVKSIESEAFEYCTALESVDFGGGVETIGRVAFAYSGLRAIRLPASLRILGDSAFSGCTLAEEISFSEGIETIPEWSFSECDAVTEILFPDSLRTIGNSAFYSCDSLEQVSFGAGLKNVDNGAFSWCPNFRTVDEFPEGLERIGTDAFGGPLQNIILPDTVTEIGERAFNCAELKALRWSAGVPVIPDGYFLGAAVETAEIPEGVVSLGTEKDNYYYTDGVFHGCRSLRQISLPSTLRRINPCTFGNCVSLEAITLPEGLETIPGYCFDLCEALREIVIPDSVTSIEGEAFRACAALESADFGSGVEFIGHAAFANSGLRAIRLPASLRTMEDSAFNGCTLAEEISFAEGIETIPENCFFQCASVREISFPNSLKTIGGYAFSYCDSLERVSFGAGLKNVDNGAFSWCPNFRIVDEFPEGLERIGAEAFGGPLQNIILPDTVTEIGERAFNCAELKALRWSAGVPVIPDGYFLGAAVETAEIPEGVVSLGTEKDNYYYTDGVFHGCRNLRQISLPSTLRRINPCTFGNCVSLEAITLPEGLETIPGYCFDLCEALKTVNIPMSLREIEEGAFNNCPQLTLLVYYGGFGERYAREHDIAFAYGSVTNDVLKVRLATEEAPGAYAGTKLLLLQNEIQKAALTLSGTKDTYEFSNVKPGDGYAARLVTSTGDEIAALTGFSVQGGENLVTLPIEKRLTSTTVRLLDADDSDISDRATILWLDGETVVARGKKLSAQPEGKTLQLQITLPKALGVVYREPSPQSVTLSVDEPVTELSLSPWPRKLLTGTVTNQLDGQPVKGAILSVEQAVNNRYTSYVVGQSDSSGAFSLDILDAPYTLTAKKTGYVDYTGTLDGNLLSLEPLEALSATLKITYYAVGEGAPAQSELDSADLQVQAVLAATGNRTRAVPQYPKLLFPQCAPGDVLTLTLSSASGAFAPFETEVCLDSETEVEIPATITQYGGVRVLVPDSQNEKTYVALFDGGGKYLASGETAGEGLTFRALPDGSYTLLLMGANPNFRTIPNLAMLDELGLKEGADYVLDTCGIAAGVMAEKTVERTVPLLASEAFSYLAESSVRTNKDSLVAGNYVTLRACASLIENYSAASDFTWLIAIPDRSVYIEGTAMLGSRLADAACAEDGMLEIPTADPNEKLRLCLSPLEQGSYEVNVFLRFVYQGRTFVQPVGSAQYEAQGLTFTVPYSVSSSTVPMRGTAASRAMIYIYDAGELIGQTQVNASGEWSADVDLKVGSYTSYHILYVEAQNRDNPDLLVTSSMVPVRYSPGAIQLQSVTMVNTAHPAESLIPQEYETLFDYTTANTKTIYYRYWPDYPEFTFIIRFSDNNPERISAVKLNVKLSSGVTRTLDAVFSSEHKAWLATDQYLIGTDTPVQLGLEYQCDSEYVRQYDSWSVLAEIEKDETDVEIVSESGENSVVYSICQDGLELLKETVSYRKMNLSEWRSIPDYGEYVLYDSDRENLYYRLERESYSGAEYHFAVVHQDQVEILQERIESDMLAYFHTIYDMVNEPAVTQIYDRLQELNAAAIEYTMPKKLRGRAAGSVIEDGYDSMYDQFRDIVDYYSENPVLNTVLNGETVKDLNSLKDVLNSPLGAGKIIEFGKSGIGLSLGQAVDSAIIGGTYGILCDDIWQAFQDGKITQTQMFVLEANALGGFIFAECDLSVSGCMSWFPTVVKGLASILPAEIEIYTRLGIELTDNHPGLQKMLTDLNDKNRDWYNDIVDFCDNFYDPIFDARARADGIFGWLKGALDGYKNEPTLDSPRSNHIDDPSGIVYEAVPGNPLKGVTATCIQEVTEYDIYGDPYTYEREWDAEEYGQINPQITDEDGSYAWDVPNGRWRVRYEKEGYETACSEWMNVPPPQFDVNIGLVSYEAPTVAQLNTYTDAIEIAFSKYMKVDAFGAQSIRVTVEAEVEELVPATDGDGNPITDEYGNPVERVVRKLVELEVPGAWTWTDMEINPANCQEWLASRIRFTPDEAFPAGQDIHVAVGTQLTSYAGASLQEPYEVYIPAVTRIDELKAVESVELEYGETREITVQAVPAAAAAGRLVHVYAASNTVLGLSDSALVLDGEGRATLQLHGKAPGSTQCTFVLENVGLAAATKVTVGMPEPVVLTVKEPVPSIESGSAVLYGSELTLSTETPGATVLLSFDEDGDEESWIPYKTPIVLENDVSFRAIARKSGMNDSEPVALTYTIIPVFVLPVNLKIIETGAFAGIDGIAVRIPGSVERIEDGAFEPHVTAICEADSYAARRCRAMGLTVIEKP